MPDKPEPTLNTEPLAPVTVIRFFRLAPLPEVKPKIAVFAGIASVPLVSVIDVADGKAAG